MNQPIQPNPEKRTKLAGFSHPEPVLLLGMVTFGFIIAVIVMGLLPQPGSLDSISEVTPVTLTPEEKQWIADHPKIWVCPDQNYPPFEQLTKTGDYQGISADLLREVAKNTGLQLGVLSEKNWDSCVENIKTGSADILGTVYISSLRDEYLIYSDTYYQSVLPIITRNNTGTDMTLEQFSGKRIAAVEGYTTTLLLKEQYPDITLIEVPDVKTGLLDVSLGTADAYFGDLAVSTYYVEEEGLTNLHIAGSYQPQKTDEFAYAFGIRKTEPELAGIVNKGLKAIPPKKRQEIFWKWISPTLITPGPINPALVSLIIGAIGALLLVTSGVILWNRTLTRVVNIKTRDLEKELTDHKKTTDTLLRTRFTIDHSHGMFLWFDTKGIIRDSNESISQQTGYTREDLIGTPITIFQSDLSGETVDNLLIKIRTEKRIRHESTIITRSNEKIPVDIVLWYFTFEGNEWFCAEIQDISERREHEQSLRESEQKYRNLFENVNDAIILFNFDKEGRPGKILEVNRVASSLTGYSYEDLCTRYYNDLGGSPHPEITDLDPKGCTTHQCRFEWDIRTKTGETIPVEANLHVFERDGSRFGLSVIRDITERRTFEVEREAVIIQIQRNLAELSLLNDGIRNPLSIILGITEIHAMEGEKAIEEQVNRIDGVINQLDKRWLESEKILKFLKKHYGVIATAPQQNREIRQDRETEKY